MTKILVSSSMQFSDRFTELANKLCAAGFEVEMPEILPKNITKNKRELIENHLKKLRESDILLIANFDGYIGASAFFEAGWAFALAKPIFTLEKLDEASKFTEDLRAVGATELNNNFAKIPEKTNAGVSRPKVGIGVWILRDGKILLGERHGAHGAQTYSPPGGHLEFGESFADCAIRETREETGLKIKNVRFLGLTNDIFRGADAGKHYITIAMLANYDGGAAELREPEKCSGWNWYKLNELPQNLFLPNANLLKSDFATKLSEEVDKSKEEN